MLKRETCFHDVFDDVDGIASETPKMFEFAIWLKMLSDKAVKHWTGARDLLKMATVYRVYAERFRVKHKSQIIKHMYGMACNAAVFRKLRASVQCFTPLTVDVMDNGENMAKTKKSTHTH